MERNAMNNKAKSFYREDYKGEMCGVTTNWSLHLYKACYIKRDSTWLGQEFIITEKNTDEAEKKFSHGIRTE